MFQYICRIFDSLKFAAPFLVKPPNVPHRYNVIVSRSENLVLNKRSQQARSFIRTSSILRPYALASSNDFFDGDLQQVISILASQFFLIAL